jgi:hypothetical protein
MSVKSKPRMLIVALACLAVAATIGVVAALGGSSADSSVKSHGAAAASSADASTDGGSRRSLFDAPGHVRRDQGGGRHHGHVTYGPLPAIEGGNMVPPRSGLLPGSVQWPVTGGWESASHAEVMNIYAGADGEHRSTGLFAIMRTKANGDQTIDYVKVAGAGPLTITKAPLGRKVARSAQKHGDFEFTSRSGITGTLHVKDDTVTLNP